jgi:trimeric autotransporter adhesin
MKKILLIALLFLLKQLNAQTISTIAGDSIQGYTGDGGLAIAAELKFPYALVLDTSGNVYFSDAGNNRIRKIDIASGIITTIAGNGTQGYSGDGAAATAAELFNPGGLVFDGSGNLFFADAYNNCIRKINFTTGIITTVAGNGTSGFSGDGGPATAAQMKTPFAVKLDTSGNLFIPDVNNNRLRKVDGTTGIITTIAGNGTAGYTGDGGLATAAELNAPTDVALDRVGNLYFTQGGGSCVRKIAVSTGIITTVAGNGTLGFSGDGGLATVAQLNRPSCVLVDTLGNLFIADYWNNRIRQVDFASGIITTLAGSGVGGYNGDGLSCLAAELYHPSGIAFNRSGNLFITDRLNNRVREITSNTTKIFREINNDQIVVYPNPFTDNFLIQSEIELGTTTVYNALGEIVYKEKLNCFQHSVNLNTQVPGIYYLCFKDRYFKLVKK